MRIRNPFDILFFYICFTTNNYEENMKPYFVFPLIILIAFSLACTKPIEEEVIVGVYDAHETEWIPYQGSYSYDYTITIEKMGDLENTYILKNLHGQIDEVCVQAKDTWISILPQTFANDELSGGGTFEGDILNIEISWDLLNGDDYMKRIECTKR